MNNLHKIKIRRLIEFVGEDWKNAFLTRDCTGDSILTVGKSMTITEDEADMIEDYLLGKQYTETYPNGKPWASLYD